MKRKNRKLTITCKGKMILNSLAVQAKKKIRKQFVYSYIKEPCKVF